MLNSNSVRFCTDIFGVVKDYETQDEKDKDSEKDKDTPVDTNPTTEGTPTTPSVSDPGKVVAPFRKTALLQSKSQYWDCSNLAAVTGFNITEISPEGTKIRLVFKYGNNYYTLDANGNAVSFSHDLTVDNVLTYGNYTSLLRSLSSIEFFRGKKIYPIIALQALSTAEDMPSIKISLKGIKNVSEITHITGDDENIFTLATDSNLPTILSITYDTATTGNGSVSIQARIQDDNDKWSSWQAPELLVDSEAAAIQFKFTMLSSSSCA